VERRAQATPLRVEQIARQQLQMRAASPAITQYVSIKDAAPSDQEARP
jgi:cell division protein FtsL